MTTYSSFFSIHRIVGLIILVSAILIASLFLFHTAQPITPTLTTQEGTLFPLPRSIKPFALTMIGNKAFTEKNLLGHWTLLFFGFTHCSAICPATLDRLNRAYQMLQPTYPSLQVVFISLDPERDTLKALAAYTRTFNTHFMGVTGKIHVLRQLQSQWGIFSARDPHSDQLQHTPSILLVNPAGQWAGQFNNRLTPTQLVRAFTHAVASTG